MFILTQNRIIVLLIVFTLLPFVVLKIIAYSKVGVDNDNIKEVGSISERTVQEEIRKRMMKSFGSVEELDRLVVEFVKQKEDAEAMAVTIREQEKQINKAYKELKDTKLKHGTEIIRLQKKLRDLEEQLLERKTQ
ncbi:MAG: hypothetical protein GY777_14000 [Candidatus Brocadiaceae bacterium]|nr:hypothetical protein [Candidatus Brocadiaceae bacterium]